MLRAFPCVAWHQAAALGLVEPLQWLVAGLAFCQPCQHLALLKCSPAASSQVVAKANLSLRNRESRTPVEACCVMVLMKVLVSLECCRCLLAHACVQQKQASRFKHVSFHQGCENVRNETTLEDTAHLLDTTQGRGVAMAEVCKCRKTAFNVTRLKSASRALQCAAPCWLASCRAMPSSSAGQTRCRRGAVLHAGRQVMTPNECKKVVGCL